MLEFIYISVVVLIVVATSAAIVWKTCHALKVLRMRIDALDLRDPQVRADNKKTAILLFVAGVGMTAVAAYHFQAFSRFEERGGQFETWELIADL